MAYTAQAVIGFTEDSQIPPTYKTSNLSALHRAGFNGITVDPGVETRVLCEIFTTDLVWLYILSTVDCTLRLFLGESDVTGGEEIPLLANKPYMWFVNCGTPNPFATDIESVLIEPVDPTGDDGTITLSAGWN